MQQIYYQDIDVKEGMFGMKNDHELFIITKNKTEK